MEAVASKVTKLFIGNSNVKVFSVEIINGRAFYNGEKKGGKFSI